jgi:hypothetical protein
MPFILIFILVFGLSGSLQKAQHNGLDKHHHPNTVAVKTDSGTPVLVNPVFEQPEKAIGSRVLENRLPADSIVQITFLQVNRYWHTNGNLIKTDTMGIPLIDFSLNTNNRKNRIRVTKRATTRCAFAGYIPEEIITDSRTVTVKKTGPLENIYIGCYALNGIKKYTIHDPASNRLTFIVYSDRDYKTVNP